MSAPVTKSLTRRKCRNHKVDFAYRVATGWLWSQDCINFSRLILSGCLDEGTAACRQAPPVQAALVARLTRCWRIFLAQPQPATAYSAPSRPRPILAQCPGAAANPCELPCRGVGQPDRPGEGCGTVHRRQGPGRVLLRAQCRRAAPPGIAHQDDDALSAVRRPEKGPGQSQHSDLHFAACRDAEAHQARPARRRFAPGGHRDPRGRGALGQRYRGRHRRDPWAAPNRILRN